MFPNLPNTSMQAETHREHYAYDNEEAYAQRYGRVVRLSGRTSRRLILLTVAVLITLAVVAFAL